jgi:MerR family copper efflux transcriptional regulator
MTIKDLARAAEVPESTVRYYEREKVLPCPRRTESGYRWYDDRDIQRLQLVRRATTLGFTLKEIRELFDSPRRWDAQDVLKAAKRRHELVQREIARLADTKRQLEQLVAVCSIGDPSECVDLRISDSSQG